VYRHLADAPIVTAGGGFPAVARHPGVVNWLVWRLFIRPILRRFARVDPTPVDHVLYDGRVLPVPPSQQRGVRVLYDKEEVRRRRESEDGRGHAERGPGENPLSQYLLFDLCLV
jgi:hypothetical protein